MTPNTVLITGGAGFIGSHLCDDLLGHGYRVRVLDALDPQVHPAGVPAYLSPLVDLRSGDVRDRDQVRRALQDVAVVVHFAAAVGVGQSMYEIERYCSVNVLGTAVLLEAILEMKERPARLLVASSMSIYGEGLYHCPSCGPVSPGLRSAQQLSRQEWDLRCTRCFSMLKPVPTPENKPLRPASVYAVNKRDQEEMILAVARSHRIPAVALRFFNTYGERQALSNPYTGVAAIFSSCLLTGQPPPVFEDGQQARDFVHVSDVVRACRLAIETESVVDEVLNVGTGRATSLLELLVLLRKEIRDLEPEILGRFREGDVRTCYADISRAQNLLGYQPQMPIEEGVRSLTAWVASERSVDLSRRALDELRRHRLVS